jgi:cyanophycin synthetase
VRVIDLPMALSGLSHHNVANALAGASAALGLGIAARGRHRGAAHLPPDDLLNPGRMNTYTVPTERGEVTVVVDLAHNEAGLEALLDVSRGLVRTRRPGAPRARHRGDRTDEILQALGEIAGLRADHVVAAHKVAVPARAHGTRTSRPSCGSGWGTLGVADIASYPTELSGLQACVEPADDGDVVAVMCHAERAEIIAEWMRSLSAAPPDDEPRDIRRKVMRARGEHEAEEAK